MVDADVLWRQLLSLSRRPDLTLQAQLRNAIAQAVLDRRLPPHTMLPSSRQLAEILGISRNTVVLAYEQLVQDGFIMVRSRSLHMVHPAALETAARTAEVPGYPDIRNLCRQFGARIAPLPMDADGLQLNAGLAGCDVLFVQPSHQNPTTVTMPLARRQELLRTASLHDVVIVEDDYDSELTFAGEATAALKALDRDERVIYVGSVSKTLAPGLRLGFMVGAREFVTEARALRRLMARHPPSNNQRAVALFLQLGYHDAAIKRLVAAYRQPTIAAAAAPHGLLFDPGAPFFDHPAPPDSNLRLGYSAIPLDRIEPGIRLLAELVRASQQDGRRVGLG